MPTSTQANSSGSLTQQAMQSLYEIATYKRKLPYTKRALAGWLGGAYLSFGGFLAAAIAGGMQAQVPGVAKLAYACLFPIGLLLIVFGQVDLFTSNCMTVTIGVLGDMQKPQNVTDRYRTADVINVLLSSWLWNFTGSLCMSFFLVQQGEFLAAGSTTAAYFTTMVHKKLALSGVAVIFRGISANWLVCLAVALASGTSNNLEKALFIWFPIVTFTGIGLEHSVANMFSFPCAILSKVDPNITWRAFFGDNILLATLGNYFGGWFVAVTWYALYGIPTANQVNSDKSHNLYMKTSSLEEVGNPIMLTVTERDILRSKDDAVIL